MYVHMYVYIYIYISVVLPINERLVDYGWKPERVFVAQKHITGLMCFVYA